MTTEPRAVLQKCAETFREYERLHSIKGTPDADIKALRNRAMAEMCEAALSTPPEPVDRVETAAAEALAEAISRLESDMTEFDEEYTSGETTPVSFTDIRILIAALRHSGDPSEAVRDG